MNAIDHVKHILERTNQERLSELFLAAAPTLRGMRRRGGWYGSGHYALGREFRRGGGWAQILVDADEALLPALPDLLVERIARAASTLGAETERHLRGKETGNTYAVDDGVMVVVQGIRRPEPGDFFYHLRDLPHFVEPQDGGRVRIDDEDGLEIRMRFWGNPVPDTAIQR